MLKIILSCLLLSLAVNISYNQYHRHSWTKTDLIAIRKDMYEYVFYQISNDCCHRYNDTPVDNIEDKYVNCHAGDIYKYTDDDEYLNYTTCYLSGFEAYSLCNATIARHYHADFEFGFYHKLTNEIRILYRSYEGCIDRRCEAKNILDRENEKHSKPICVYYHKRNFDEMLWWHEYERLYPPIEPYSILEILF